MKILVLGATGMLGYEVFKTCLSRNIPVIGVVRKKQPLIDALGQSCEQYLHTIDDVKNIAAIEKLAEQFKPTHLINCVGIVKQAKLAEDYYESVAINAFLPHQLEKLGEKHKFKLIHVSTDCVFDGKKGFYKQTDLPNAYDLYGKSKHLGEVGYGTGITLRTSIIGHEITKPTHGLLEWFLAQEGKVKGFTKAIFSGLTTYELTRVILDIVIAKNISAGVYHVAVDPISKYDLISLIAEVYEKNIEIDPSAELVIDRSLDASEFNNLTGYKAPSWKTLILQMHADHHQKITAS